MAELVPALKAEHIADGAMVSVVVRGHEILLARAGEEVYATDNRCPHMGGDLSRGTLDGTVVTCPRHGSRFDLASGRVVRWLRGAGLLSRIGAALKPAHPLRTYGVRILGDDIFVEID